MQIVWKPIAGYEELYEVSNSGIVRNCKTGTIIKPYMRGGYLNYNLWCKNKQKTFPAHRLVVMAFIKEDLAATEVVHHIDGDPLNNTVGNLAVMTRGEHSAMHLHRIGKKMVQLRCPSCQKIFDRNPNHTHLEPSRKAKATFCCRKCAGKFWKDKSITDKAKKIAKNVIKEYRRFL